MKKSSGIRTVFRSVKFFDHTRLRNGLRIELATPITETEVVKTLLLGKSMQRKPRLPPALQMPTPKYMRLPNYGEAGHKTLGNWYTTLLQAHGNPVKHFGDLDPGLSRFGIDQTGPIKQFLG